MARQQGILKFKGNIGSFSMYKTQDGFQGREKSGIERTDSVHRRGERLAAAGNLELLKNFEFNSNSKLMTTYQAPFSISIDRATGKMTVALNRFSPQPST